MCLISVSSKWGFSVHAVWIFPVCSATIAVTARLKLSAVGVWVELCERDAAEGREVTCRWMHVYEWDISHYFDPLLKQQWDCRTENQARRSLKTHHSTDAWRTANGVYSGLLSAKWRLLKTANSDAFISSGKLKTLSHRKKGRGRPCLSKGKRAEKTLV